MVKGSKEKDLVKKYNETYNLRILRSDYDGNSESVIDCLISFKDSRKIRDFIVDEVNHNTSEQFKVRVMHNWDRAVVKDEECSLRLFSSDSSCDYDLVVEARLNAEEVNTILTGIGKLEK